MAADSRRLFQLNLIFHKFHVYSSMLIFIVFFFFVGGAESPRTTKNRELLFHDGFEYRQKSVSKDGGTQFWNCIKKDCNGRAHSPFGRTEPLNIVSAHNHARKAAKHEARLSKEAVKDIARQQPDAQPRNVIAQERAQLSDEARMNLPSASSLQRSIERQREIPDRARIDANEIANVVIEGIYRHDLAGNRFLLYDSRQNEPDDVVFFLYATEDGLRRLRTYRDWASDGTFKVASRNFLQVYTINCLIDHSSVPAVFALMANKAEDTYIRVLQNICTWSCWPWTLVSYCNLESS